ncbi:hypothetical protein [Streptomyces fumanus]|uniref:hypothetical protein n=1 Tax=Streptomyces fumanus TaxID=67302 RepID=UPI0033FCB2B3
MTDRTKWYEVSVYSAGGELLSLSADREAPVQITTEVVWSALAVISAIPAEAWMHWDDGESELERVSKIVLRHYEVKCTARRHKSMTEHTLEVINR